ncbi:MAG: hypothetical protein AAF639_31445 [Chloroflexota bacterium]
MEIIQLLPELRKLKRTERLHVMQFLVSELAQEEIDLIQPDFSYSVRFPDNVFKAADTMLQVRNEEKTQ